MDLEHESTAVQALDNEGLDDLATKLDNGRFADLSTLEKRTTIAALKSWRQYLMHETEDALKQAKSEV